MFFARVAVVPAPGSDVLSSVDGFVVGRDAYGSVKWLGETDIRSLALDSIVQIMDNEVAVYSGAWETRKPREGTALNKPAEVTLLGVWPGEYSIDTGPPPTLTPAAVKEHEAELREYCK